MPNSGFHSPHFTAPTPRTVKIHARCVIHYSVRHILGGRTLAITRRPSSLRLVAPSVGTCPRPVHLPAAPIWGAGNEGKPRKMVQNPSEQGGRPADTTRCGLPSGASMSCCPRRAASRRRSRTRTNSTTTGSGRRRTWRSSSRSCAAPSSKSTTEPSAAARRGRQHTRTR